MEGHVGVPGMDVGSVFLILLTFLLLLLLNLKNPAGCLSRPARWADGGDCPGDFSALK